MYDRMFLLNAVSYRLYREKSLWGNIMANNNHRYFEWDVQIMRENEVHNNGE